VRAKGKDRAKAEPAIEAPSLAAPAPAPARRESGHGDPTPDGFESPFPAQRAEPGSSNAALRLEHSLHDLTNALAAARAYADVLYRRVADRPGDEAGILNSLATELDRAGEIARLIRFRTFDDFAIGDALTCLRCGATFVHRRGPGKSAQCRRCRSFDVTRWRAPTES
jgi:ribosomal protein L40E